MKNQRIMKRRMTNPRVSCLDIELAILSEYDFRRQLIVPNVSAIMGLVPFETDMLILTPASMAYGFEIKVSRADLRAEFSKPQHTKFHRRGWDGSTGLERFYGRFRHFFYAVPEDLRELAMELIPDFCGLWVLERTRYPGLDRFYLHRPPAILFNRKWTERERYEVARLGAMRVYTLKSSLNQWIKNAK